MWRIHQIGGLSSKDNIVVLFNDGNHIYTCLETHMKGIICCYFWRVMLYLSAASSRNFQSSNYQASVQQIAPQRNRFGVAFSIAKTAINIALETKSDNELVQLLKDFILAKRSVNNNGNNSEEIESSEIQNKDGINTLQQHLIDQTNDPHVTKIQGAPSKKRI
ncbi:hypothetical protein C2G38_2147373 [Gigaspora rosea]|uniref:Uncharacterized protein n=1 Tax=Gigaspora rosea TaxID=44941 RepID=A0A397UFI3_9GLOM|nr:hypothetical protein C2G38_2147373 [Gigaspora rosea]